MTPAPRWDGMARRECPSPSFLHPDPPTPDSPTPLRFALAGIHRTRLPPATFPLPICGRWSLVLLTLSISLVLLSLLAMQITIEMCRNWQLTSLTKSRKYYCRFIRGHDLLRRWCLCFFGSLSVFVPDGMGAGGGGHAVGGETFLENSRNLVSKIEILQERMKG